METIKCPSCSAPVENKNNARSFKCDFCGSQITIKREKKDGPGLVSDKKFKILFERAKEFEKQGDLVKAKEAADSLHDDFCSRGGDVGNYLEIMNYFLRIDLKTYFFNLYGSNNQNNGYFLYNNKQVLLADKAGHEFGRPNNLLIANIDNKVEEIKKYITDVILCEKWPQAGAEAREIIEEKEFRFASMCYCTFDEIYTSYIDDQAFWFRDNISSASFKDSEKVANIYFYTLYMQYFHSKILLLMEFPKPETDIERNWIVEVVANLKVSIYLSCRREFSWLLYGHDNKDKWSKDESFIHDFQFDHSISVLNDKTFIKKIWAKESDIYLDLTYRPNNFNLQQNLLNSYLNLQSLESIYDLFTESVFILGSCIIDSPEDIDRCRNLFETELETLGRTQDEEDRKEFERVKIEQEKKEAEVLRQKLIEEEKLKKEEAELAERRAKREAEINLLKKNTKKKLLNYKNKLKNIDNQQKLKFGLVTLFIIVPVLIIPNLLKKSFITKREFTKDELLKDNSENNIKKEVSNDGLLNKKSTDNFKKDNLINSGKIDTTKTKNSSDETNELNYKFITVNYDGGDVYKGNSLNGVRNGLGTYIWSDGQKYVGNWSNGKRDGSGTMYYVNGDKYIGEYKNNKMHGEGTYTWANGNIYKGSWKSDIREGFGSYYWKSGDRYVGEWKASKQHGKGTYKWPNGDKYVGNFKFNRKDGYGTYTWASGSKYEGRWVEDKMID